TVTQLAGEAGGLIENVQRWREQVRLPRATEQQLREDLRTFETAEGGGSLVDLAGPDGARRERILGLILPRGGVTWFFKMRGPADLVGKQRDAFEAFVKSVRFDGGNP